MISDFSLFFLKHFNLILSEAFSLCVIPCSHKQQYYVTSIWVNNCLLRTQTQGGNALPALYAEARKHLLDMHECVTNIAIFQFSSAFRKQKIKQPLPHAHITQSHTKKTR